MAQVYNRENMFLSDEQDNNLDFQQSYHKRHAYENIWLVFIDISYVMKSYAYIIPKA